MNIALIIAGGKGVRMHSELPKQFISVHDKPVIVYTLEAFQRHPNIDEIYISCLDGWDNVLNAYARQFKISKLKEIVKGGDVGQQSIYNGITKIAECHAADDMVLIHDSIRPLVSSDVISDCIVTCQQYGNAITTIPCAEAMLVSEDGQSSQRIFDRDCLKRTQTPQAFRLGDILEAVSEIEPDRFSVGGVFDFVCGQNRNEQ